MVGNVVYAMRMGAFALGCAGALVSNVPSSAQGQGRASSEPTPEVAMRVTGDTRRVTIDVDRAPLQMVLNAIASRAGLNPAYVGVVIAPEARVTLHVHDVAAIDAFRQALQGTGLRAYIHASKDVFVSREVVQVAPAFAGIITGVVLEQGTRRPLRGAMVSLDHASQRIETDAEGRFRLTGVTPGEHTVIVRLVGYTRYTQTVTIQDERTIQLDVTLASAITPLDQVVVTGTIIPTERKAVPNAMTVITAQDIERRGITRIDQLFHGEVPGIFAQNRGASNGLDTAVMYSRGSVTLDNLTPSAIKTYVDGVELASAATLTQIDPRSIERIEILTGPQASTIYGSNAINGVMQVFTKRGTAGARPQLMLTALTGFVQNNFSSALTPQHDDAVQVSGTEGRWSYNAGASWTHMGAWSPARRTTTQSNFGGASLHVGGFKGDVTLRLVNTTNMSTGPSGQVTTDGRASGLYAPLSQGPGSPASSGLEGRTLGISFGYAPFAWWSHMLTLGTDDSNTDWRYTAPGYSRLGDTLLYLQQTTNRRTSLSYSTTVQMPVTSWARLVVSAGGDGWHNATQILSGSPSVLTGALSTSSWGVYRQPGHNAGGFVQGQLGLRDALFVTYGLRAEWNPNYGDDAVPNLAPRFGAAYTRDLATPLGVLTAKVRGSYGRSTRPPLPNEKASMSVQELYAGSSAYVSQQLGLFGQVDAYLANPDLGPETQQGGEGGVELYFGNRGSLVLTRYNQTTDHLISIVGSVDSVRSLLPNQDPGNCYVRPDTYCYFTQNEYLNVGSIRNQGWEGQGSVTLGPFITKATYSFAKSRVIGVDARYRYYLSDPKYQPGAMFNYLAEHMWAFDVTYSRAGTAVSLNVNGVGQIFQGVDDLYYTSLNREIRLNANRARMTETRVNHPVRGYPMADMNMSHRVTSVVETMVQIQNVGDRYENDWGRGDASLGRQVKGGVRVRW